MWRLATGVPRLKALSAYEAGFVPPRGLEYHGRGFWWLQSGSLGPSKSLVFSLCLEEVRVGAGGAEECSRARLTSVGAGSHHVNAPDAFGMVSAAWLRGRAWNSDLPSP